MNPERNDIDVSALFAWGNTFKIVDGNSKVIIEYYMRLPSDGELNRARVYALRKSAALRKLLSDPTSEQREAFVADEVIVSKDNLIGYISRI